MKKLSISSHAAAWTVPRWIQAVLRWLALLALVLWLFLAPTGLLSSDPACGIQTATSCSAGSAFVPVARLAEIVLPPSSAGVPTISPIPADLPSNIAGFMRQALPYALQAHRVLGWQTSVILAQWGLEQGWQVPGYTGYNWGNVGAMPGLPTVPGTSAPGSPDAFCYAATPADGLREYLLAAQLPYYRPVFWAAPLGPDATAVALGQSPWDAGHYTDSGQPGSSLLALLGQYDLYRFDVWK